MLNWIIFGQTAVLVAAGSFSGTGLVHMTAGVLDSGAWPYEVAPSVDQLIVTNHAGTDVAAITPTGDLSYASGSFTVTGFQGRPAVSTLPTNGQTWVYNTGAGQWQLGTAGGLTSYGADLSATSTATAQYVDALSFSATGAAHGAGGTIAVNGTATVLNWVDAAATIQKGGTTLLQLGAASTDFAAFGASPGSLGYLRVPSVASTTWIGANGVAILSSDGSNNTLLNSATTSLGIEVSGSVAMALTSASGGSITSYVPTIQFLSSVASGTIGWSGAATAAGAQLSVIGQNAGGVNQAGGALLLQSGAPTGSGAAGTIGFGLGGTTNLVKLDGTGNLSWSSALTPQISQAQQAAANNPINFTIAPQAPGAGAASTATGTPGSLIVGLAVPVSTGAEAYLGVTRGGAGNLEAAIGPLPGAGAVAAGLWLSGAGLVPSGTNYTIAGTSSTTQFNAPSGGTLYVGIGNVAYHNLTSTSVNFGLPVGGNAANSVAFQFSNSTINDPGTLNLVTSLSTAQLATPNLTLTGTINGQWTIQFGTGANGIAGRWELDVNQLTFANTGLILQAGASGASATIAVSVKTTISDLIIVRCDGAGHIAINAS